MFLCCGDALCLSQRVQDVQGSTRRTPSSASCPRINAAGNVSVFATRRLEPLRRTPSELDRFELTPHAGSCTGRRVRWLGQFLAG